MKNSEKESKFMQLWHNKRTHAAMVLGLWMIFLLFVMIISFVGGEATQPEVNNNQDQQQEEKKIFKDYQLMQSELLEHNYIYEYIISVGGSKVIYKGEKIGVTETGYRENATETIIIPEEGLVLEPNKLYLGKTVEHTETDKYVPMLNGRSSIGRLGITIHVTAAFGDVGFKGTWTLEIFTLKPVRIYPNMEICQICYYPVIGDTNIKYQGKYLNQHDVTASRLYKEYN